MPFRETFDCLWCGLRHAVRGRDDIEGWAQLCPDCVGRAGDNGFLRFRVHQALTERAAARGPGSAAPPAPLAHQAEPEPHAHLLDADDWYLREGRYARGPVHDAAWNAELDAAGRWLDTLPLQGEIVELGAGTGWWAPLLAGKGELSLYDERPDALERARERLVAHRLRAHLHPRDTWAEPDRRVDAVFTAFRLGRVAPDRLPALLGLIRRWLRDGGRLALIERIVDPHGGAGDPPLPDTGRRGDHGPAAGIAQLEPEGVRELLRAAGFAAIELTTTGRFFLLGQATAAG
jgi:SAM-dependent methyltransferase